jgi:hypothetical protein
MTEAVLEQRHAAVRADSTSRLVVAAVLWALLLGNAAAIVWLWVHGGNASDDLSAGELLTSLARLTGLLGAYAALVQVVLLARLPWLERLVGFDRLTVRHRWNGHVEQRVAPRISLPKEISTMLGGGT